MPLSLTLIRDLEGLRAVEGELAEFVAASAKPSVFRGPQWLLSWWHSYQQILAAELHVYLGRDGDDLVGFAPLYKRVARHGPGIKLTELRLMGDAGPRPPAPDLLVAPGYEERFGGALAGDLDSRAAEWGLLELEPLRHPSRCGAHMANRLAACGHRVASQQAGGGARSMALSVVGIDVGDVVHDSGRVRVYEGDPTELKRGLSLLRRMSRLEWGDSEENSPLSDEQASQLLEEMTVSLGARGKARLSKIDKTAIGPVAVSLVIDDCDRAVVLAMAVDPEHGAGAATRLIAAEAKAAADRGCVALDVVTGAREYDLPSLPMTRHRALSLRVFTRSASTSLARTFGAFRRRVDTAKDIPGAAAAGARAAWTKIRTAATSVARYSKFHLYRGELWTRGIKPTRGLALSVLEESVFDAATEQDRLDMMNELELDVDYCRDKWSRGDITILARLFDRPAGIAWCANGLVPVPEFDRSLQLDVHEAYIHDVFVAPRARGRAVAPCMLDYLASELRKRDFYRSWAIIGNDNGASIRAFEKAAYTAVADIVHARMGAVDRLIVRPPDPEAKKLLGL